MTFDPDPPALAERLGSMGYRTRGYSANVNVSPLRGFDRGFDDFWVTLETGRFLRPDDFDWSAYLRETEDSPTRFVRAIRDIVVSASSRYRALRHGFELKFYDDPIVGTALSTPEDTGALSFLEVLRSSSFGSNEFLFCNLVEVHTPYRIPEEYRTVEPAHPTGLRDVLEDSPNPDTARAAYDDCCRYLSDIYREIFQELRNDFDYIITLSDHGELFGEHGYWEHEWGIYPEQTQVPLIVFGEDLPEATASDVISLRTVYDMILGLAAGADRPLDSYGGQMAYTECHGITSHRRESLLNDGHPVDVVDKYDRASVGLAKDHSYTYQTPEGLVTTGDTPSHSPGDLIDARRDQVKAGMDRQSSSDISKPAERRLEQMGYI